MILLNFDQLSPHYFARFGSILPNLNHFAQYWFILLDLNQLSSRNLGHLWFNLVNFEVFHLNSDYLT